MAKDERPVRYHVRLTTSQGDYIEKVAKETYRTPQQVIAMLLDEAILRDGYRAESGKPTALRKEEK